MNGSFGRNGGRFRLVLGLRLDLLASLNNNRTLMKKASERQRVEENTPSICS